MSLVSLATAKLHLRIDASDEDALIQAMINAAETAVINYIGRYLYADSTALAAAIAAAPAALSVATAAYQAAVASAVTIADAIEREIALEAAHFTYVSAQTAAKMTHAGIVVNDAIQSAVLLHVGALYESREATSSKQQNEFPLGHRWLLNPYRIDMGV